MLTNAKVGTKLLALIIAPVMVLLAVASLGARDRIDDATAAEQVEGAADLTTLTDATTQALNAEMVQTAVVLSGGPTQDLVGAREDTTRAVERLEEALTSAAIPGATADRLDQVTKQMDELGEFRASIDNGDAQIDVALDAYAIAVDELIRLEGEVAQATSAAGLSITLGNAAVLSQAQLARAQLTGVGVVAIDAGEFGPGDLDALTDLAEEEQRLLDRFADGAGKEAVTALGDALATPEVAVADQQVAEMISDATIGGLGRPDISLDEWVTAQQRWLDTIGGVDEDLVSSVSIAASDRAFTATKAARLFMMATAAATLLSILLAVWVARSIDRPLRRLTVAANRLASEQLPRLVENLRSPDAELADEESLEPIEVVGSDEIGQVTEAFNAIQQVTMTVAEEQSSLLRKGIGDIFVNLARRNQSLLDRQIEFIDELESKEQDPDLLENLFRLDHLATRMRRNAESLLVLAGAEPARRRAKPVALSDVVRVAVGEVEDFTRIELREVDDAIVAGNLAVDLSHLLSELMENATHFSPPETAVEIAGQFGPEGAYVLAVADHGIGMSAEQLAEANQLLASPPLVGLALGRSLGFIVVGRIVVRLGLRVHLNASPAGGVTAVVSLPADLVSRPGSAEPRDPLLDRLPDDAVPLATTLAPSGEIATDASVLPAPATEPTPLLGAPMAQPEVETLGAIDASPPPPPPPPAPPLPGGLPSRRPEEPATPQLSDALPSGDAFEDGLAALIGSGEAPTGDVEHEFWGELADEQPSAPSDQPGPDPDLGVDTGSTSAGSAFDGQTMPDADTVVPPASAPVENIPPPPPPPAPEAPRSSRGLVRRVPGAAAQPATAPGPAADAPRRSPEQVRAMLSRYRDGRKGRPDQEHSETGSMTEEA